MANGMTALVFVRPGELGLDQVEKPQFGPDEVLVRPKVSGICHSDFDLLAGHYTLPFDYPIIPGHEWSGEVVEVGSAVGNFQVGDRVTGECVTGCDKCDVCQTGNFTYCGFAQHFGFTEHGATAEYTKQRARKLHKLPSGLSWEEGALVEPFTVAYFGLQLQGGTDAGETVLIFGGGAIGACAVAAAHCMGATVVCAEPLVQRRRMVSEMGADFTLDPMDPAFLDQVKDLTGGSGVDLALEASGNPTAQQTIIHTVRNNGRITFTGINVGKAFPVEMGLIQARGLNIKGAVGSPYVWERALRFIEKAKPNLTAMVTHRLPLQQAVQAFAAAKDRENAVKVHVTIP